MMKSLVLLVVAAFAGQAFAQAQCDPLTSAIPECARSCIASADSAVGCAVTDYKCGCAKSAEVQQRVAGCVLGACPISTIGPLQSAAAALCSCAATASSSAPATTLVTTTSSTTTTDQPPSSTTTSDTSSTTDTSSTADTTAAPTTAAPTTAAPTSSTHTCA